MIRQLAALEVVTLFVSDLAAARVFYGGIFGRPVLFEDEVSTCYSFENIVLNLLQRSEAGELVEPRPLAGAGSGMLLTIKVPDVDAVCGDLQAHGVAILNGPTDRPWGRRTAAFADPSGHIWEVAHDI